MKYRSLQAIGAALALMASSAIATAEDLSQYNLRFWSMGKGVIRACFVDGTQTEQTVMIPNGSLSQQISYQGSKDLVIYVKEAGIGGMQVQKPIAHASLPKEEKNLLLILNPESDKGTYEVSWIEDEFNDTAPGSYHVMNMRNNEVIVTFEAEDLHIPSGGTASAIPKVKDRSYFSLIFYEMISGEKKPLYSTRIKADHKKKQLIYLPTFADDKQFDFKISGI